MAGCFTAQRTLTRAACFSLAGAWVTPGSSGSVPSAPRRGLGGGEHPWLLGKKGKRGRAELNFVSAAGTQDALVESTLVWKKDRDPRVTGGMGRKDAKGEAEVCAKQLGLGSRWLRAFPVPGAARARLRAGLRLPVPNSTAPGARDRGTSPEAGGRRGSEWTDGRRPERYMASSREAQKQLGVGCSSKDLRLPFSRQHKLIFPLRFLSCLGGSRLAPSPFTLHDGEVRGAEECLGVRRESRKVGQIRGEDHPGSRTSMETFHRLGEASGRKGCCCWQSPIWVSLGMLTRDHSSLYEPPQWCLTFFIH